MLMVLWLNGNMEMCVRVCVCIDEPFDLPSISVMTFYPQKPAN